MPAAIAPILIALASFVLRLINLGSTKGYIFDEVYYVDGARDLLKYGVEVSGSNPEFIVHPPVGKWLIGGGFSQNFVGAQTINKNFQVANDGSTTSNYLNSISSANGGTYTMLRFAIAREKIYKRGNILNASFIVNAGFRQLAKSTVSYTVDGQNYNHEFTTNGNFAGFRLTYFFRPLKTNSSIKNTKTLKS
jgi:dolichyl-phosphate-mannose--protein O-mannosyl transferase